jgi:hypothetical protein
MLALFLAITLAILSGELEISADIPTLDTQTHISQSPRDAIFLGTTNNATKPSTFPLNDAKLFATKLTY